MIRDLPEGQTQYEQPIEMTIEGALILVRMNCNGEALERMRSRKVAKVLADEIERLTTENTMLIEQLKLLAGVKLTGR